MKRGILAGLLTLVILVASVSIADAQVVVQYKKKGKNYTLDLTYASGYYSSTGYGFGNYGYGGYYPYGVGSTGYYGTSGTPYYPYGGSPYGSGYPPYGYRPYRGDVGYPGPYPSGASTERLQRMMTAKDVEDGLARFKAGDYRGALAFFKEAVGGDTENALAPLLMGLALAGVGDLKNAEKAFRSAFEQLSPEEAMKVELPKQFKDAKEQARYLGALEKDEIGKLTVGVVAMLMSDKAKAKAALKDLAKDAVVQKLLDHVSKVP